MAEHVLVALDGSEQSWEALEFALDQFSDAEIVALHVIDPIEAGFSTGAAVPGSSEEWYEGAKAQAEELFDRAGDLADEGGATLRTAIRHGRPTREILDYAAEHGADHLVLGSHSRSGVSRILLGSVAEAVVRRSPVPVTVVR